ncbi:Decaprenyl-diphosphate synthase subunit 2 [Clonorchis sinensis]|uniref:Decaprenyl-diphosphate synthase subunit 2 n=1 Tax=Clonorchis sinensis TaxID=79923 RepID=A0A3R7G3J6_CLOSI|nr:Decaprenyl-diphosphate synthase subunit 2 [Clonorchis sinensis]
MSNKWKSLIIQAEKLLGGPAPFINLSSLLTSEVEFLASRARRLAGTVDHPFFSAVRACFQGRSGNYPFLPLSLKSFGPANRGNMTQRAPGGLIILLAGQCSAGNLGKSSVKLSNQYRKLAEVFETVHLAVTIHKSLVDPSSLKHISNSGNNGSNEVNGRSLVKDWEAGNKVATLVGDVLLASVSTTLAEFRNTQVLDVVSESIGNMFEAEFLPFAMNFSHGSSASSDQLELSTDQAADQWLHYIGMSHGSLLGSCCQATLLLAGTSDQKQFGSSETGHSSHLVHELGYNWALLLRLLEEREFVHHIWANKTKYVSSTSFLNANAAVFPPRHRVLNYINNGLPEPTLLDAVITQQLITESAETLLADGFTTALLPQHASRIFNAYDQLGQKLANNLSQVFDEFSAISQVTRERASSSALNVLGEMIHQLNAEACLQ